MRWSAYGPCTGFVRKDRLPHALAAGDVFARGDDGSLRLLGESFAERSERIAAFAARLEAAGEIALRRELFPLVDAFEAAPSAAIDRGLVPWLGVRPYGVHLCAHVRKEGALFVFVAVRSKTKSFPGAWDNSVAGGQPLGLSLLDNVIKECDEEASIPREIAARAVPTSTITYVREDATGLKPDTLFCYDLELPPDFEPRPRDGEVERFLCIPAAELAHTVREQARCKPNCSLVWIEFLLRHGELDGDTTTAERTELRRRLRAPLP